jgi:hypothetical protein
MKSGLSISGVVMSTLYHLIDLDIRVYVISDNVIELPPDQTAVVPRAFLDFVVPKFGRKTLTLEEALRGLGGFVNVIKCLYKRQLFLDTSNQSCVQLVTE